MAKIFHPRNPSLQRETETNRRIMVKKNRDTWKDVEENLMLDGRGWNFPYFIGANAVESPLNLHVETGPSVMRITKPVALDAGVGSAIPEVCQLIYTGLVQTRTAARSPITLFGCETRARFVARLFTFEQRNDRARLLNRIDDGEGNGSIVPTAFVRSLLWKIVRISFFHSLSCSRVFGLLAFLLFGFVSILCFATRYGHKRVGFVGNSVAWRGNVILTYCCNFFPVWKRDEKGWWI